MRFARSCIGSLRVPGFCMRDPPQGSHDSGGIPTDARRYFAAPGLPLATLAGVLSVKRAFCLTPSPSTMV